MCSLCINYPLEFPDIRISEKDDLEIPEDKLSELKDDSSFDED